MQVDEERARLGYSDGRTSRVKSFMAKTAAVIVGGVMLASAFALSLVFFAFAFAAMLVLGSYIWWKTRDLRRQMRERIHAQARAHSSRSSESSGEVIEGVVISRSQTRDDSDQARSQRR